MNRWLLVLAVNIAIWLLTAFAVLPLVWMLWASFCPSGQALGAGAAQEAASGWVLDQYRGLFTRLDALRFFRNSLIVAGGVTLLSLIVNSLAGYAFAKLRFRGRERLFRGLLLTLLIPGQVAMLPLFLLLRQAYLVNSYWGVILPAVASVYGIFLVRQYALSIPDGMLDAARLDGASEPWIYVSIVLPMLRPVLVALGTFTFLATWNDFMWPLIVLSDDRKFTLPVAMAILSGQYVQDVELMMAGAVVTILPVLVLFFCLQKYLMGGIAVGSIKG